MVDKNECKKRLKILWCKRTVAGPINVLFTKVRMDGVRGLHNE